MLDRNGMAKTINIGYYFVAFIDIVGQRDKLKQLVSLPSNAAENEDVARILLETSWFSAVLLGSETNCLSLSR